MVRQKFLELYDSYFDDVYRYVYFKVGNKWDTDDVVSETFRKAYEKFSSLRANPKYWLFSIARNTVIDFYRKRKDIAVSCEDIDINTYSGIWQGSPEENLELIELKEAIQSLPEEELEMINLRWFADMTYKEIGKYLNKSEASVKMKFSRIIKKLQEMLNIQLEG